MGDRVSGIVEGLLAEALPLSTHVYGNYVISHLLEHGSIEDRLTIMAGLTQHVSTIGTNVYGPAVLGKALDHASPEAQMTLTQALFSMEPGLLANMGCTRHGHLVVEQALQLLEVSQRQAVLHKLMTFNDLLVKNRYGRML